MQQLQIQLATPLPFDLDQVKLSEYKHLGARWHDWEAVKAVCANCATLIFDRIIGLDSVPEAMQDNDFGFRP